jgi:hypothetical protein
MINTATEDARNASAVARRTMIARFGRDFRSGWTARSITCMTIASLASSSRASSYCFASSS